MQALALLMPKDLRNLIAKTAGVAGSFVPFGTFCLMLGDVIRVVDSSANPELLHITVQQLFGSTQQLSASQGAAPFVLQHLLTDHHISSYKSVLATAAASMVPLLFMGGRASDYQPVLIQRQTAQGMQT
jgi:hypothetical protein